MKKLMLIAALVTGLAAFVTAAEKQGDESADKAAIQKTMDTFAAAWNKHDSKAMAAVWAQDGDLINPAGRLAVGREQVEKLFTDEHSGPMKTSTMEMTIASIKHIGADTVWADATATAKGMTTPDGKTTDLDHHLVLLFVKHGADWQVLAARPYVFLKQLATP